MAYKWSEQLIEDNYCRYECSRCKKSFIVGEVLSNGSSIICPYCHSDSVECTAMMDQDFVENSGGLGCAGIYIREGNNCDKTDCLFNDEGYCEYYEPDFETKKCYETSE